MARIYGAKTMPHMAKAYRFILEKALIKDAILSVGVFLFSALAIPAHGQSFVGPAEAVDGDSLTMTGTSIRLFGIDAPDGKQTCERNGITWSCGDEAHKRLSTLVEGKKVSCNQLDTDEYGRVVATCTAAGLDIGETMVASGMATAFRKYSNTYVEAEERAKQFNLGIWGSNFVEPADWRAANPSHALKATRKTMSPAPVTTRRVYKNAFGCAIKGNRNRKGQWIYHLPGMPYYDVTRPEELFCTEAAAQAAGYRRAIVR